MSSSLCRSVSKLILLTCVQQDQEEEGVSRVRVTSRRSPHKVERVSGVVTRSHVDAPKVSESKPEESLPRFSRARLFTIDSSHISEKAAALWSLERRKRI